MKFSLDFIACCCKSQPTSEGEERSFVRTPRRFYRRRRRCPSVRQDWRPSLSSISEDYVPVTVAEKVVKKRAVADDHKDHAKVQHLGGILNDHGRASFATILPTFAPTPFMF